MLANGDARRVRHAAHYGPFSAPGDLQPQFLPVEARTLVPGDETFVVRGSSRLRCLIQQDWATKCWLSEGEHTASGLRADPVGGDVDWVSDAQPRPAIKQRARSTVSHE